MERVEVLVVDDSAFMRRAITSMLEAEPDISVVATARSGEEAVAKALQLEPDVITMDVEMPGMGGLEAVRQIVARRRIPIIMVSALTREGAETTFTALDLGAVDFIAKPDAAYVNIRDVARDLVAKVRTFGRRQAPPRAPVQRPALPLEAPPPVRVARGPFSCVAVGTSTGGPVALSRLIPALPANFPMPLVVVQHMPLGFTKPLADRLDAQSKLHVVEAAGGEPLRPGEVLVVPSGRQPALRRRKDTVELELHPDDGRSLHVPSVDILTSEVAEVYGPAAIGVILTGMGQDGVQGLRRLKARGGYVIGQDESTCVVYGMPRAAARAGLVDRELPIDAIPQALVELGARTEGEREGTPGA